jgi:hypothetical protein
MVKRGILRPPEKTMGSLPAFREYSQRGEAWVNTPGDTVVKGWRHGERLSSKRPSLIECRYFTPWPRVGTRTGTFRIRCAVGTTKHIGRFVDQENHLQSLQRITGNEPAVFQFVAGTGSRKLTEGHARQMNTPIF